MRRELQILGMLDASQLARRRDLGRFLRRRRSLLLPAEIGLPVGGRRHVRGLRRSEVTEIADIGVTWYSMLEQGRVDNVSPRTLDAIAKALRFEPVERGSFTAAAACVRAPYRVRHGFVLSPSFDVVAYNARAAEMFEFTEQNFFTSGFASVIQSVRPSCNLAMPIV